MDNSFGCGWLFKCDLSIGWLVARRSFSPERRCEQSSSLEHRSLIVIKHQGMSGCPTQKQELIIEEGQRGGGLVKRRMARAAALTAGEVFRRRRQDRNGEGQRTGRDRI